MFQDFLVVQLTLRLKCSVNAETSPVTSNPMPTYELFAPLSNTRGTFQWLQLGEPFRIQRWPKTKVIKLWRLLASLPKFEIEVQAESSQGVHREKRFAHVAVATVNLAMDESEEQWRNAHAEFDRHTDLLQQQLRLASLFLGGHVEAVVAYWYSVDASKPQMESGVGIGVAQAERPATVSKYNYVAANEFLRATTFPLKPEYVQLAFEHWEESHRATRKDFELLSLVMALEALFNVGAQDIRYRVARSVAVLLGEDPELSDHIFEAIGRAYEVRSKLVHTGKAKGLEKVWLWQLDRLVQEAILRCLALKQPKDQLSQQLTRIGFGCGAQVTANPAIEGTAKGLRPSCASHVKRWASPTNRDTN